jgi:hypothetical protein
MRWHYEDAINHDPLRMRITNLTQTYLNSPLRKGHTSARNSKLDNGSTEIKEILCGYYAIDD